MKELILAGGGHGHILVLKELIKRPLEGYHVTLITDYPKQYYSGMLSGYVEEIYTEEDISFNVPELCKKASVRYVEETITAVDREKKLIATENGEYPYDVLSMNLGVRSKEVFPLGNIAGTYVKPIGRIVAFKKFLQTESVAGKKLFIVGGGASGMELAFSFREAYPDLEITVATSGEVCSRFNQKTRKKVRKLSEEKKIQLLEDTPITALENNEAFSGERSFPLDYIILSTGFTGIDVDFRGFDISEDRFIWASDDLHVAEDVLAMGDMINLRCYPTLNKAGVFAIREAPVLLNNLMSLLRGGKKRDYKPQSRYLQILNCGSKKAILNWSGLSLYGHLSWRLKDRIDRKYMN